MARLSYLWCLTKHRIGKWGHSSTDSTQRWVLSFTIRRLYAMEKTRVSVYGVKRGTWVLKSRTQSLPAHISVKEWKTIDVSNSWLPPCLKGARYILKRVPFCAYDAYRVIELFITVRISLERNVKWCSFHHLFRCITESAVFLHSTPSS